MLCLPFSLSYSFSVLSLSCSCMSYTCPPYEMICPPCLGASVLRSELHMGSVLRNTCPPYGLHLSSVWATSALRMGYICPPYGPHLPSVWATSVLRMGYICPPYGLHLPSIWAISVLRTYIALSVIRSELHLSSFLFIALFRIFFFC